MPNQTIRAVPPGHFQAEDLPAFTYLPESDLPALLAADAQPWRVDPTTNEQWFRIATITADDTESADGPDDDDSGTESEDDD